MAMKTRMSLEVLKFKIYIWLIMNAVFLLESFVLYYVAFELLF